MTEDLDELLMAYLEHYDEIRQADYFMKGSSERYHRLRAKFEDRYDTDRNDLLP